MAPGYIVDNPMEVLTFVPKPPPHRVFESVWSVFASDGRRSCLSSPAAPADRDRSSLLDSHSPRGEIANEV